MVAYQLGTDEVPGSNPGKGENFLVKISNWSIRTHTVFFIDATLCCLYLLLLYCSLGVAFGLHTRGGSNQPSSIGIGKEELPSAKILELPSTINLYNILM